MHNTELTLRELSAGYPQGNEVQYGVAYKVAKIMTVRAVPNGDERDKDVRNILLCGR